MTRDKRYSAAGFASAEIRKDRAAGLVCRGRTLQGMCTGATDPTATGQERLYCARHRNQAGKPRRRRR